MGWIDEHGFHEGYLVPRFHDQQLAYLVTGGSIPPDQIACGPSRLTSAGHQEYPTRPAGEVTGWVVCCDCTGRETSSARTTWVGPEFTRVPSAALEDVPHLKVYAPDDDVAYVSERDDVEQVAVDLWRSGHVFSDDAISAVQAASEALAAAKTRLDSSVAIARSSGASWAAIGRAADMTRQSAQERWGRV